MALLVPNLGEIALLNKMLGTVTASTQMFLGLYSENVTPIEATVYTDVDNLDTNTGGNWGNRGYAPVKLTGANWTVADVGAGVVRGTYNSAVNFVFGDGTILNPVQTYIDVYGYTIVNEDSVLLWAERFTDGPYRIPAGGGTITITPRIELD